MSRSINCFLLFCKDNRDELLDVGGSNAEVTSVLGAMWRKLPGEEKEKYKLLAKEKALQPRQTLPSPNANYKPFLHKFKLSKTKRTFHSCYTSSNPSNSVQCSCSENEFKEKKGAEEENTILSIDYFKSAYAEYRSANPHHLLPIQSRTRIGPVRPVYSLSSQK